jgi:hypothetical protein
MKRRKQADCSETMVHDSPRVKVHSLGDTLIFEVDEDVTQDVAEAVSMIMHNRIEGSFWSIPTDGLAELVDPERALYWLSGGDREWSLLEHYSQPWPSCSQDFRDKWSETVTRIVMQSKTLADIRAGFRRELTLHRIYDWCISRGLVR